MSITLHQLFDQAIERKASDLHLVTGESPRARVSGKLSPLQDQALSANDMDSLLREAFGSRFDPSNNGLLETWLEHGGLWFAGTAFRDGFDHHGLTFCIGTGNVSALADLVEDRQAEWEELLSMRRGLAIVSGRVGSGKWTIAASVTQEILNRSPSRIFVCEHRPGYFFKPGQGLVSKFYVGQNVSSCAEAMKIALHADLDVFACDDLQTEEDLRQALTLANTGHLVIANITADTVEEALAALLGGWPSNPDALRQAIAKNLVFLSNQFLTYNEEQKRRIPSFTFLDLKELAGAHLRP